MAQRGDSFSGKSPGQSPCLSARWEHLEAKFAFTTSVPLSVCPKARARVSGAPASAMDNALEQCILPLLSPGSLIPLI